MSAETMIDVRTLAPRERHPRVFAAFDELSPGGALLLVNDHDPRPLFYQLQAERPGQVEWVPQEEGPERWVIRIQKAQDHSEDQAVTLDVRPDIREGREPFARIMAAV